MIDDNETTENYDETPAEQQLVQGARENAKPNDRFVVYGDGHGYGYEYTRTQDEAVEIAEAGDYIVPLGDAAVEESDAVIPETRYYDFENPEAVAVALHKLTNHLRNADVIDLSERNDLYERIDEGLGSEAGFVTSETEQE